MTFLDNSTKARVIADRLIAASTNAWLYADEISEWGHRRYLNSLRRVVLLTYALQHP